MKLLNDQLPEEFIDITNELNTLFFDISQLQKKINSIVKEHTNRLERWECKNEAIELNTAIDKFNNLRNTFLIVAHNLKTSMRVTYKVLTNTIEKNKIW